MEGTVGAGGTDAALCRGTPASLTVVVPAWNEADGIDHLLDAFTTAADELVAAGTVRDVRLIVVDDGSTDGTAEIVERRATGDPRVCLVRHEHNRGLGAAVRTGIHATTTDLLLYTDADLPVDLAEIAPMVHLLEESGADLVVGRRRRMGGDGIRRRFYTWAYDRLVLVALGVDVPDVNFAFKLIRTELATSLGLCSEGSFIDAELVARAQRSGHRMVARDLTYHPRRYGRSSLSTLAVIRGILIEMARHARSIRALGPSTTSPPETAVSRFLRGRTAAVLLVLLAVAPIAALAVKAHHGGWAPIGDNAVIVSRAHDVFSRHSPQLGMPSGMYSWSNRRVDPWHPGPAVFWAMAPAVAVLGDARAAPLLGVALTNAVSIALVGLFARRRAGLAGQLLAVTLLVIWVAGALDEMWIFQPLNPTLAAIPMFALLVCSWAAIVGDRAAWPAVALLGTLVIQADLAYLLPATVAMAAPVATLAVAELQRRRRGKDGEEPAVRPARLGSSVWLWATIVVLATGWALPAWDALAHDGGNVREMVRSVALGLPTKGWPYVAHSVTSMLRVSTWLDAASYVTFDRGFDLPMVVFGVVAVAGLVAGWRSGDRRLRACIGLAVVTALVTATAEGMTPAAASLDPKYLLPVMCAGAFLWLAVAASWVRFASVRWSGRTLPWVDAPPRTVVAAMGTAILFASAALTVRQPLDLSHDWHSAQYSATGALVPRIERVAGRRPFLLRPLGGPGAVGLVESCASRLLVRGRPVKVSPGLGRYLGTQNEWPPDADGMLTFYLVERGERAPRSGVTRLATWRPAKADPDLVRRYERAMAAAIRAEGQVHLTLQANSYAIGGVLAATSPAVRSARALEDTALSRTGATYLTSPNRLLESSDETLATLVEQYLVAAPASMQPSLATFRSVTAEQPVTLWVSDPRRTSSGRSAER
jgi:glycosyltransferase involved in cell wall biosynthesis